LALVQFIFSLFGLHRYVDFYLDHIASEETISLLYHLATKAKTVRDADEQYSEVSYLLYKIDAC
jgi:sister-chromatid-cohesion protein PDS5